MFFLHSSHVTGVLLFQRFAKVAKLVLVLPHTNADAKWFFFGGWSQQDKEKKQLGPRWAAFLYNDNQNGRPQALL